MPKTAALNALLGAMREEVTWLLAQAEIVFPDKPQMAETYIHRARNLQAVLEGYERLHAKEA
jgi:hypothetical protein